MAPRATVRVQPPSRAQKNRTITPAVVVRVQFGNDDGLLDRVHDITAMALLHNVDGTEAPASARGDYVGRRGGKIQGRGNTTDIDFTFSGLQIRDAGTFYFRITVGEWNHDGLAEVVRVDTNNIIIYDP